MEANKWEWVNGKYEEEGERRMLRKESGHGEGNWRMERI